MKYQELFGTCKPVFGMLHLKGDGVVSMLERAKQEIQAYLDAGVDALLVENYFGSADDCETVLAYLQKEYQDSVYGVNILGDYATAFELAAKYGAKFIQIDSVCGHLRPMQDERFAQKLKAAREKADVVLLGGVRFKYQPINSGRTLEEDLMLGAQRCDAIVVTGAGTGMETPVQKVEQFRAILGDFPLVVGAGVTLDTVEDTFRCGDGAIVGSWFKVNHDAHGDVCEEYVKSFMDKKRACTT